MEAEDNQRDNNLEKSQSVVAGFEEGENNVS